MQDEVIDLSAIQPETLYPPKLAGKILRKSTQTLANDRCAGRGCAVTKVGGTPYYKGSDLLVEIERGRVEFPSRASARRVVAPSRLARRG